MQNQGTPAVWGRIWSKSVLVRGFAYELIGVQNDQLFFPIFVYIPNMPKKPRKMRFGRYDDEKVPNSRENFFCYAKFLDCVLTYLWERDILLGVAHVGAILDLVRVGAISHPQSEKKVPQSSTWIPSRWRRFLDGIVTYVISAPRSIRNFGKRFMEN